mmetsp:Transcript_22898/g.22748  ORF Transcript_22898/g.22748 Transcript_22898/m.22748 type:complete len:88 (-) Transcript_22898:993-1256(-)
MMMHGRNDENNDNIHHYKPTCKDIPNEFVPTVGKDHNWKNNEEHHIIGYVPQDSNSAQVRGTWIEIIRERQNCPPILLTCLNQHYID